MDYLKKTVSVLALLTVTTLLFGCGEKETNVPAVKLTASAVVSQPDTTATVHTHTVSIPFTDVSAFPIADAYQYRSDTINGHSHVIALTRQQMIDINNGMRVDLTSSSPDIGANHTHSWNILGGNLLYEKNCYNCHTNDKRGHGPMNVSFNPSQTGAVMNPGGAPLSTSPATLPDQNYMPAATVSLDGVSLYTANCASCHGALATSSKQNRTFSQIKSAISSDSGGMASLGALTDAQIQAIATALLK